MSEIDLLQQIVALLSGRQSLPPWQESQYFLSPVVTSFEITQQLTWTQVVGANTNRVGLWLSVGGNALTNWTPNPTGVDPTSGGLRQNTQVPAMRFTFREDGPLVQSAWYASVAAASFVTAIEIVLRTWPGQPGA